MTEPLLAMRGITKQYPGCLANDAVDLTVLPGEIHALLGENGAGKSTLVKTIYGIVDADAGEIRWRGAPVHIVNPNAARRLGIGMVFQHFSLFDGLTVLENVALGLPGRGATRALAREIVDISRSYGLPLDPSREVHALSVGERQRIEIVRCLLQDPQLLIMDEPTSVLTPQEVTELFRTLRTLAAEGRAILYISHKLQEIKDLCETATILRQGRVVANCDPRQESTASLAQMMIGDELAPPGTHGEPSTAAPVLSLRGLSVRSEDRFGIDLQAITLDIRPGEILGIAGVAGNGQVELLRALCGETLCQRADEIVFADRPIGRLGPRKRRELGLAVVPEERLGHAAVPAMDLTENAVLTGYAPMKLVAGGLIRMAPARNYARSVVERFDVRTAGIGAAAASLSGGNLQKYVVGREVLQDPAVLVASQPTWGVDAGAASAIRRALRALAERGAAVVVISQDLDELMEISDRIAVINVGHLSEPQPTGAVTVEGLGLLMGGVHGGTAQAAEAAP
ncbi:MAG: ABC transporter ATP-binding protein [Alphaproteobacteria bacterium]